MGGQTGATTEPITSSTTKWRLAMLTPPRNAGASRDSSRVSPRRLRRIGCTGRRDRADGPPLVIIHGTALHTLPEGYRRYLEHYFCEVFKLEGTPLRIQFKTSANPYVGAPARRKGH